MFISCDNKCIVKVGAPRNPLALVPKSKTGWMSIIADARSVDHGIFFKSNVVHTACFLIHIPDDFNL